LPDIADAYVIRAFLFETTCESMVHKLGRKNPRTTKELLNTATIHRAIFDHNKGKDKLEDSAAGKGGFDRFHRKKNKKGLRGLLVAAAKRKGGRAPGADPPDFFEKKLEGPCPSHAYPVKHAYKDCSLIKRFLSSGPKRRGPRKKEPEGRGGDFPEPNECI
jgi:hypothetical protein